MASWKLAAGVVVEVIVLVAVIGFVVWLLRMRANKLKAVALAAVAPLGLTPVRYGILGWQASGQVQGRTWRVMISPAQKYAPSSLVIEMSVATSLHVSIGPKLPRSASWVRSKLVDGVELSIPELGTASVHAKAEPARAHALAAGGAPMLMRLMRATNRSVFVRPEAIKLQAVGEAWELTPASLRADLDDLVALAAAAERA